MGSQPAGLVRKHVGGEWAEEAWGARALRRGHGV